MKSSMRHKIIRKKRENKRDLRRAAKAMHKAGMTVRSKKTREEAKLALKVSNANPDKEAILTQLLKSRDAARVVRSDKRQQKEEDRLREAAAKRREEEGEDELEEGEEEGEEDEEDVEEGWEEASDDDEEASDDEDEDAPAKASSGHRARLVFGNAVGSNFRVQFTEFVDKFVFPTTQPEIDNALPVAFLVALDVRCGVQSLPLELLDRIVDAARAADDAAAAAGKRAKSHSVLLLFVATKCDLVSAQAIGSTMALVSEALHLRYVAQGLPRAVQLAFAPFSYHFDKTGKHIMAILRAFATKVHGADSTAAAAAVASGLSNMKDKLCVPVIGFPNSGRRTLGRTLVEVGSDSAVSVTPVRSLQRIEVPAAAANGPAAEEELSTKRTRREGAAAADTADASTRTRIVVPNAKLVTILTFPEDAALQQRSKAVTAGDIVFHSFSFIEKLHEPEAVAAVLVDAVLDRVALSQCFSLPLVAPREGEDGSAAALNFLKRLGSNIRRDKGFVFASPLLAGTGVAGQITASSLTASTGYAARQDSSRATLISAYSGAVPGKVIRVAWSRVDQKNALKLGARAFLKEWHSGRHLPWAILRPMADSSATNASGARAPYVAAVEAQKRCVFAAELLPPKSYAGSEPPAGMGEAFAKNLAAVTFAMKDYLALLPQGVVEFGPNAVVPEQHDLSS